MEMLGDRRIWEIALALCIWTGLIGSFRLVLIKPPRLDDPDASLREIAAQHLGQQDGLEQVSDALKKLPEGGSIIFFGSATDPGSAEIYLLASYLHWPHRVWFVHTGGPLAAPAPPPPPKLAGAHVSLFFYDVEPPPFVAAKIQSIRPKLRIITNTEDSPE